MEKKRHLLCNINYYIHLFFLGFYLLPSIGNAQVSGEVSYSSKTNFLNRVFNPNKAEITTNETMNSLSLTPNIPVLNKGGDNERLSLSEKQLKTLKEKAQTLRFEQNIGQISNAAVLFRANDAQATYFFTKKEVRSVVSNKQDSLNVSYALQFIGSNDGVQVVTSGGQNPKQGTVNYITSEGQFMDVQSSTNLSYKGLWQGVDADFYAKEGRMKYDFIIAPHTDPSVVRFRLEGAKDLTVNAHGELEFVTAFGTLQKGKPFTYQIINGEQVQITCDYYIEKGEVSFKLGKYDPSVPLVIDPIALKWSTFLGGSLQDSPLAIVVDPTTKLIYVTGSTTSLNFPNTLGRSYAGGTDGFLTCLAADGTNIVWSTYFGGSSSDVGRSINIGTEGDLYIVGTTSSADFPMGTTAAYDAIYSGNLSVFVARFSNAGLLKYSSYIDNLGIGSSSGIVVKNGLVYSAGLVNAGLYAPVTAGAYQPSTPKTQIRAYWFALNTNVAGVAGLEYATYFAPTVNLASQFTDMVEDKDGNLWLSGITQTQVAGNDLPMTANAMQTIQGKPYEVINTQTAFVAKFSKSGNLLYSSAIVPFWGTTANTEYSPFLTTDAEGNLYIKSRVKIDGAAIPTQSTNVSTVNMLTAWSNMLAASNIYYFEFVAKIPYNLAPQYDFVTVMPATAANNESPGFVVDKKGNIHIYHLVRSDLSARYMPLTPGAIQTNISNSPTINFSNYLVLSPSGGGVLYSTFIGDGGNALSVSDLFVTNNCTAYLLSSVSQSNYIANAPITPTYRDFSTNTQKSIYRDTYNGGLADALITVFHEPIPNNNTITDFAVGNNTFCANGAIWQDPNDGPIIGSTPTYTSGDGSSSAHNLPNIKIGSAIVSHPTPSSPALSFQWQKSVNGGAWTNVGNGTYIAYKPEPEATAGTVNYRRLINTFCCDSISVSNIATATIAGTFNLDINTPSKPVYYCPGVAGTNLGITVTGATGNISWQWYDGFTPLSGTSVISPSSGSGVAQESFSAAVGTGVTGSGFYRLVITDAGGCRKEAFISIAPKTASAGASASMSICPGGIGSVKIGPSAVNPDFLYSWTGPSGFTSSLANPIVTVAGTYTLQVKVVGDASFCAPGTSVIVNALTPHDAALTALTNKAFCQPNSPAAIGLSGTPPSGYVFQWTPGNNLDNTLLFNL
jgi:hypothetical protein